jgi:TonB family protein
MMRDRKLWKYLLAAMVFTLHSQGANAQDVAPQEPAGWGRQCIKPVWPKQSLMREEEGTVLIKFVVDVDGKVIETTIHKSSGFPLLDQATRQAVERCRFKPDLVDGKPVQTSDQLQYVWSLGGLWQPKFP